MMANAFARRVHWAGTFAGSSYVAVGRHMSTSKVPLPVGRSGPPSNTMVPWIHMTQPPPLPTASRLAQPFLHSSPVRATYRQTHRHM